MGQHLPHMAGALLLGALLDLGVAASVLGQPHRSTLRLASPSRTSASSRTSDGGAGSVRGYATVSTSSGTPTTAANS